MRVFEVVEYNTYKLCIHHNMLKGILEV